MVPEKMARVAVSRGRAAARARAQARETRALARTCDLAPKVRKSGRALICEDQRCEHGAKTQEQQRFAMHAGKVVALHEPDKLVVVGPQLSTAASLTSHAPHPGPRARLLAHSHMLTLLPHTRTYQVPLP